MCFPSTIWVELLQDEVQVKLVHVFACENNTEVQRWLRWHGKMQYLLNDIQDFARQYLVYTVSGKYVHIDKLSVDFVIAGTSCVDISAENPRRAELAGCVEEGTNSSGGTWHGFLDVLQLLRPSAAPAKTWRRCFGNSLVAIVRTPRRCWTT